MRNPRPASASVKLLFDRSYDIASVRRTITRHGYSHLVNSRDVPAAEYSRVLANIGFDSTFPSFVIFQGDIQNIATMKPKMPTQIFEEMNVSIAFKTKFDECQAKPLSES
jgi:chromosome segregation ATPase